MKGKPNPRRAELAALSMAIRPLVKAGVYANVNEGIREHWQRETGRTEWDTFKGWRDKGRPVRKGETGYPIWATPRHLKPADGAPMGDLGAIAALNGLEPTGPQWFPVAYIFHDGQTGPARELDPEATLRPGESFQFTEVRT